jgi:hypothetical protein
LNDCTPIPPARLGPMGRTLCGLVAIAALAWVAVAAGLRPDNRGHSTHLQLGLTQCHWRVNHGGRPCPSCGMTTAFSLTTHGQWGQALAVQPVGALIALAVAATFWIGLWGAISGSKAVLHLKRLLGPIPLLGFALLVAAGWVYTLSRW